MRGKHLEDYFKSLDKDKLESIIGLNNPDSLRYGFPQTSMMNPGLRTNMIEKSKFQETFSDILSKKGTPGKRVAYIHMVAEAIYSVISDDADIFAVEDIPSADNYDVVIAGFWVDKGTSDKKATKYLQTIKNKNVALFATAGVNPNTDHAKDSLVNAAKNLDESNTLIGTFICQGKFDPKLLEAFKQFPEGHPHAITPERIARHKEASTHPDEADLENARAFIRGLKNV